MNKILCIDKNSALSEKMSAYLAQNNISADFYNSTEDCISRIISGSYSLIAMNIGYYSDWVSAIITIHRQSTVPIVLISEKRNSGSAEASYTYNANNLRASKTVNREKIDFVWNGQNLAAENKSGEVNTYTYDPTGVHIANQNGNITSYLKDYHGNVVGTTTVAGTMVQEENNRMDYDAFGNQWIGDTPDPFGYCGEYYDSESGLVYLRNRYYDSKTGRFITEDPIKDGLNWYVYANNNPIFYKDLTGLAPEDHDEFGKNSAVTKRLDELGRAYCSTGNKYLQADYHAEAELIRKLERLRINQGLQSVGIAYPYNTVEAVDIIKEYSDTIVMSSHIFNMPKPMIASILYREIICYNVVDWIFDGTGDTSRGLGQIKPSTAQAAEQYYSNENPNTITVHTLDELNSSLESNNFNIYSVALVLWHCAKQVGVWIDLDYDYSNSARVLARYNGTGDNATKYRNEVHEYLDPFVKYYWEVY